MNITQSYLRHKGWPGGDAQDESILAPFILADSAYLIYEAGDKRPPLHLFEEIVQQPAPSFYMEPITIKFLIERNLRYHGK